MIFFSSMNSQSVAKDPISTIRTLPFSFDEKSFNSWLGSLKTENKVDTLKLVLTTLKQLNQVELKLRFIFLQKLAILVHQLTKQLHNSYIKSQFPFSKQNKLRVMISAYCNIQLAENFSLLCKECNFNSDQVFSHQQKVIIIFNGILAQANVLLYKSILYEKPDKGFWNLCFLFYFFAKQNDALYTKINTTENCFINLLKKILLLELSCPQQFNTEELFIIFHLLNKQSEFSELSTKVNEANTKGIAFINLREDLPPSLIIENREHEQPYLLYISNLRVIKNLLSLITNKASLANSNKVMLLRLIKSLSMNQQRKSDRKNTHSELFAIVGTEKLNNYLLLAESKSRADKLAPPPGVIQDLNLEIVPIDDNGDKSDNLRSELNANVEIGRKIDLIANIESADIWPVKKEQPKAVVNKPVTNADLFDKSTTGFGLRLRNQDDTLKVGEIIGLIISEELVITMVRRIAQVDKNDIVIGVEIIGNNATLLDIIDIENKGSASAFYLINDEQIESIVINTNDFQNEEHIFVDKDDKIIRYKIVKQLQTSSIVKHLKVIPS